jgi:hypothetical protein
MVKLYIERSRDSEGSRIKTKLVTGALLLSFLPVLFMVLWSYQVLNMNIKQWFSRPAENVKLALTDTGVALAKESQIRARAQASWMAGLPEIEVFAHGGPANSDLFEKLCDDNDIVEVHIESPTRGKLTVCSWDARNRSNSARRIVEAAAIRTTCRWTWTRRNGRFPGMWRSIASWGWTGRRRGDFTCCIWR